MIIRAVQTIDIEKDKQAGEKVHVENVYVGNYDDERFRVQMIQFQDLKSHKRK